MHKENRVVFLNIYIIQLIFQVCSVIVAQKVSMRMGAWAEVGCRIKGGQSNTLHMSKSALLIQ